MSKIKGIKIGIWVGGVGTDIDVTSFMTSG